MFIITFGNIIDDEMLFGKDAFVLPTNPKMRYGMGISDLVYRKAGIDELEAYCEKTFNVGYSENQLKNDMVPTEIRVTPGFGMKMDIIFAQSPNTMYFDIKEDQLLPLLKKTYVNVLKTIYKKGYKNVLLPSLGTGHYGFNHDDVAKMIVPLIQDFCITTHK